MIEGGRTVLPRSSYLVILATRSPPFVYLKVFRLIRDLRIPAQVSQFLKSNSHDGNKQNPDVVRLCTCVQEKEFSSLVRRRRRAFSRILRKRKRNFNPALLFWLSPTLFSPSVLPPTPFSVSSRERRKTEPDSPNRKCLSSLFVETHPMHRRMNDAFLLSPPPFPLSR